jgi:tryptophan-rich sensory protein
MTETATLPRLAPPRHPLLGLLGFVAIVFVVGAVGSTATLPQIPGWYAALDKPGFTPPDAVFGPVWSVLFLMIAVSGWLVWRRTGLAGAPGAFVVYGVQLALNALWSVLFFGLHRLGFAFVELIAMWLAILATIIAFRRYSRPAALLLVPSLIWVTYAGALNATIWRLNG